MAKRFDSLLGKRDQCDRILRLLVGKNLNPRSPKQVSEYLYGLCALPKPAKDPTNEKQLLKILTKTDVPSIKVILASRGAGKLASSLKFRLWDNGKDL